MYPNIRDNPFNNEYLLQNINYNSFKINLVFSINDIKYITNKYNKYFKKL